MPAYAVFLEKMETVESLIRQERLCDPRLPAERSLVLGLRGGAAVLMVAAFEGFLKDVFTEYIRFLDKEPPIIWTSNLTDRMRIWNVYENLRLAAKSYHEKNNEQLLADIPRIRALCEKISMDIIAANAFSSGTSNPMKGPIQDMFFRVGLENVFQKIHKQFERIHGPILELNYFDNELDRIVKRRHHIAHTADARKFTEKDLMDDLKLLKNLAQILNQKLRKHIKMLVVKHSSLGEPSYSDLSSLLRASG